MQKSQITMIVNGALCLWLFCYLITSFVASHKCYYVEVGDDGLNNAGGCYEGDGFNTIFQVGAGKSFQAVVVGLTAFFHACYTAYVTKTGKATSDLLTLLLGMSYMIIIMLLIVSVFWGAQQTLMKEFEVHGDTTESADGGTKTRKFVPNNDLVGTFGAECAFSVLSMLCELGLAYALTFWKDELIAGDGAGYGAYDNFSSGGANPAPYEAPKGGPEGASHYNDL